MAIRKACQPGHHHVMKLRTVCVRIHKKVRHCKHGARGASGKCPKGRRAPRASMHGPINYSAKVKNASRLRHSSATKIQGLLRGKHARRKMFAAGHRSNH